MRQITRILLLLLSYAPIATVAVAAQAKASEMDGEDQNTLLVKVTRETRHRLLPDGHTSISYENLNRRYTAITGLTGAELERSIASDVQTLIDRGSIRLNEKGIVSEGPSQFAEK